MLATYVVKFFFISSPHVRAGLSGSSQGFNDKAHYLLDKFAYLVDNITLNVCLTIDLLCEPTGCMVHLGPECMGSIYQGCTVS